MNCSKCGSSVKEGTKFCTACGAPVSEAGDSEVATPVGVAAADLAADSVAGLDSRSTDSAAGLDSVASSAAGSSADPVNSAATPDAGSVAGTKTQPIAAASSQGAEASSKAGDVADGVAAPTLTQKRPARAKSSSRLLPRFSWCSLCWWAFLSSCQKKVEAPPGKTVRKACSPKRLHPSNLKKRRVQACRRPSRRAQPRKSKAPSGAHPFRWWMLQAQRSPTPL